MRYLMMMLSSAVLIGGLSGCSQQNSLFGDMSLPKLSIPSLDLSNLKFDPRLPAVQNVKIESSLSEVALEWKPVHAPHVAGYRILRNNDAGQYAVIATLNDPYAAHYTDPNTQQRKYNAYAISYFTDDGRVSKATKIRLSKLPKAIAPLPYVTVVSNLPRRIKILWRIHPDPRVIGYRIDRFDPTTKSWQPIHQVDKRLSVEYIDRSVESGKEYQYRVIAIGKGGVLSPPSKVVTGHSKMLPPPPQQVMATTNLPRKVELIWKKPPMNDLDHFNVYASSFEDSLYRLIAKTRATHYTDRFDNDGEIRFYRVTTVDKDGLESTQATKPVRGMTLGHLVAPKVTSARIISNRVELKWENQDKRTVAYNIYKSFWNGWRVKKVKFENFTKTTFVDPAIQGGTTYTYYVTAVDANGIESAPSREVKVEVAGGTQKKSSWF